MSNKRQVDGKVVAAIQAMKNYLQKMQTWSEHYQVHGPPEKELRCLIAVAEEYVGAQE